MSSLVVDDLAQQQVHLNQAEEFIAQDALGCHCFLAVIGLTGADCSSVQVAFSHRQLSMESSHAERDWRTMSILPSITAC
jgi:hypothetical protein